MAIGRPRSPSLISVVIPAHNEAEGIRAAIEQVCQVLDNCEAPWEIVVVDDGSRDDTYRKVEGLHREDSRVRAVRLSRNFGKEAALLAGLEAARGEVVVTMDADLQHPPALIPQLIEKWQQGARVVHATKANRRDDALLVRVRALVFNSVMTRIGHVDVRHASDFKLIDRVAVDAITRQLPERRRFFRGLADWIGYPSATVPFDVQPRTAGTTHWSLPQLTGLAVRAIVSFSTAPLRIITLLGFSTLVFSLVVAADAVWSWWDGETVSGFATVIIALLVLSSSIMISLGIIGEYIAMIYEEIKARPAYLIEADSESEAGAQSRPGRETRAS